MCGSCAFSLAFARVFQKVRLLWFIRIERTSQGVVCSGHYGILGVFFELKSVDMQALSGVGSEPQIGRIKHVHRNTLPRLECLWLHLSVH